MPEPPDFNAIAVRLIGFPDLLIHENTRAKVISELVAIWNARGAADIHAVEDRLSTLVGWVTSEPYRLHLKEAIREQDK